MKRFSPAPLIIVALLASCSGDDSKSPTDQAQSAIDAQAQTNAAGIMAGDAAALDAALNDGGFALVSVDGVITDSTAAQRQGTAFDDWDRRMMLATTSNGAFLPLVDLADALTVMVPEADVNALAEAVLTDVRTDAASDVLSVRARARLINELGKLMDPPYDILGGATVAEVSLNPTQLGLIIQQLATGILVATDSVGAQLRADGERPCTMTDTQSFILDADAALSGKGFDALLGVLENAGMVSGTVAKRLGYVNIALTYIKAMWALMSFEVHVFFEPDDGLTRTKTTTPGGTMELRVEARLNIGDAALYNCIRPVLTKVGIDFSLFNDGPLKGAVVDWVPRDFVVSRNDGVECVEFAPGTLGTEGHATSTRTGADGISRINLRGVRQSEDLGPRYKEDLRRGLIDVRLNLKEADLKSDLLDAVGGVISAPAEMAYRNGWGTSRTFNFPVNDWIDPCKTTPNAPECGQGWQCDISYTASGSQTDVIDTSTATGSLDQTTTTTFTASGNFSGFASSVVGGVLATTSSSGEATFGQTVNGVSISILPNCTLTNTSSESTNRSAALTAANGNGIFFINASAGAAPYNISLNGLDGTLAGPRTGTSTLTHAGTECGPDETNELNLQLSDPYSGRMFSAQGTAQPGENGKVEHVEGVLTDVDYELGIDEVTYEFHWSCDLQ